MREIAVAIAPCEQPFTPVKWKKVFPFIISSNKTTNIIERQASFFVILIKLDKFNKAKFEQMYWLKMDPCWVNTHTP